jgi:hypothetical protein
MASPDRDLRRWLRLEEERERMMVAVQKDVDRWPPLTPEQASRLRAIFEESEKMNRRFPERLDVWEFALRCGHKTNRTFHHDGGDFPDRRKVENCDVCQAVRAIVTHTLLGNARDLGRA